MSGSTQTLRFIHPDGTLTEPLPAQYKAHYLTKGFKLVGADVGAAHEAALVEFTPPVDESLDELDVTEDVVADEQPVTPPVDEKPEEKPHARSHHKAAAPVVDELDHQDSAE